MSRHYLMLSGEPSLRSDLDRHVSELTRLTGLVAYDVRQSLLQPGVSLLGSMSPEAAARAVQALSEAGYSAAALDRSQLSGVSRPRRVASALLEPGRVSLLEPGGAVALAIDGESRALLVAADLDADPAALAQSRARSTDPSLALQELSRGCPVLRVYLRGQETSAVVLGRRFNYRSLGALASVSGALNFQALVGALQAAAGESALELDFQLADTPPVRVELSLDETHPKIREFEAHARVTRALWEAGVGGAGSAPPSAGSAAPSGYAVSADAAAQVMAEPGRQGSSWQDQVRRIGPWWLLAICAATWPALLLALGLDSQPLILSALGLCAAPLPLYQGLRALMEKRDIEDYPTSRARSVAMGKVELVGRGVSAVPVRAPWSGVECVWFRWTRMEARPDPDGGKKWRVTGRGGSNDLPFLVEDETGQVMVDPAGADIRASRRATIQGSYVSVHGGTPVSVPLGRDTRIIEETLPAGRPLYVLGTARPMARRGADRRLQLRDRVRALKADPSRLMAFDANGDGRIDPEEWEVAVASLEQTLVEEALADPAVEGGRYSAVIGRGAPGDLFLISDRSEGSLRRGLVGRAALGLLGGLALAGAGVWGLLQF